MAVARIKTWVDREVLTHSDLNTEISNITDNGEDLAWPATKAKDFNGQTLTLDADGDSDISAAADDIIVFKTSGSEAMRIDATQTLLVGSTTTAESPGVKLAIGGTAAGTLFRLLTTENGAAAGPAITLERNSASPAASDVIGQVNLNGRDSADAITAYAQIGAIIRDPATGSEDGVFFMTAIEDTAVTQLRWGPNTATEGSSLFIANTTPQPTTSPVGGGLLYCLAGALRYLGTSGTDAQLGAA